MFGVVPKVLWNKVSPSDEANRVLLACNLLVISTPKGRVVVDTGMGDRWDDVNTQRYDLKPLVDHRAVLDSIGLQNNDVQHVVISHLHFDHAGGGIRLDDKGNLVPTFPKAKYHIQQGEWDLAHTTNARARGSYRNDDYDPLEASGNLDIINGDTEIVPGVWARVSGGHTSHHQVVMFESQGRKGVFFADIMPTKSHVQPPWVMGYDHFPLESCNIKNRYLKQAADEGWLVVFDHEPDTPWGQIEITGQKFNFVPLQKNCSIFDPAIGTKS
jgi:glyoxylase-like metal-dependent hydrolase (beta-lactamase superfamily II)